MFWSKLWNGSVINLGYDFFFSCTCHIHDYMISCMYRNNYTNFVSCFNIFSLSFYIIEKRSVEACNEFKHFMPT